MPTEGEENTLAPCSLFYLRLATCSVDTQGQHVPPCVRYGMTCLIIRNTIGSVSCSVQSGLASYFVKRLTHIVQEGPFVWETLALKEGPFVRETIAKYDILL
jgi:hypothetical protein